MLCIPAGRQAVRLGLALAAPALIAIAAAQNAPPSLDEILQKGIEARGGADKIKAIQNVKLTGKMMFGGQIQAPFTMMMKRPALMHIVIEIEGQRLIRAFDGTAGWTVNPMTGGGEARKLSDEESKDMQETLDMDGALIDYAAKGHKVELSGKEDVQSAPAWKLKITKKSGRIDYTWLDAKTFLPVKTLLTTRVQGAETEVESYPSDYKPVNGVMSAFSLEQKTGGKTTVLMTVEKMEVNTEMDDAVFKMPARK